MYKVSKDTPDISILVAKLCRTETTANPRPETNHEAVILLLNYLSDARRYLPKFNEQHGLQLEANM